MKPFVTVVLELALDKPLDYRVPEELLGHIFPGARVEVPVRGKLQWGFVIELKESSPFPKVLPIHAMHKENSLTPDLFTLALWMASYYGSPLSKIFKTLLPASVRKATKKKEQLFVMRKIPVDEMRTLCSELQQKSAAQAAALEVMLKVKKGILLTELLEEAAISRAPVETLVKKGILSFSRVLLDDTHLEGEEYFRTAPKTLTGAQGEALTKIAASLENNEFKTHLLHGITGSGKTEIYLQAVAMAKALGKGSLILAPEIALTTQMVEQFRKRFDCEIAILHHRLSDGERNETWQKIAKGQVPIVLGPRSAIFVPHPNIQLIIVDEEHDSAYKQSDEAPFYNARDLAVMRGKLLQATVILGSATPSLESYQNALSGKYVLSNLPARAESSSLPRVHIIDMKKEYEKAKGFTLFSEPLINGIKTRLGKGEQTLLFLNRRGFHTSLLCLSCRKTLKCKHCDVALTFHKNEQALKCHLCGFTLSPPPKLCLHCRAPEPMQFRGFGTEQVEQSLKRLFPEIRTLRMDADTTRHKGSHQKLYREFASGKTDVLIGTQMVAKGLHFPQVTLVGVLAADGSLNIPDFRASETTFQLLTQVAGRAGRGVGEGEVMLQTNQPESTTILTAAKQDYIQFYHDEIEHRKLFHYPPFTHLVKVAFTGNDSDKTEQCANAFRQMVRGSCEVLPVVAAAHARVKDKYRFHFLIKTKQIYDLHRTLTPLVQKFATTKIKISVDIDTLSTFF